MKKPACTLLPIRTPDQAWLGLKMPGVPKSLRLKMLVTLIDGGKLDRVDSVIKDIGMKRLPRLLLNAWEKQILKQKSMHHALEVLRARPRSAHRRKIIDLFASDVKHASRVLTDESIALKKGEVLKLARVLDSSFKSVSRAVNAVHVLRGRVILSARLRESLLLKACEASWYVSSLLEDESALLPILSEKQRKQIVAAVRESNDKCAELLAKYGQGPPSENIRLTKAEAKSLVAAALDQVLQERENRDFHRRRYGATIRNNPHALKLFTPDQVKLLKDA